MQAPGNLKNILKKNKKPKLTDEEKERLDKSKKKSAVHNFLKQGLWSSFIIRMRNVIITSHVADLRVWYLYNFEFIIIFR